jgi:hypothetical protein
MTNKLLKSEAFAGADSGAARHAARARRPLPFKKRNGLSSE